jgi:Fe-S cluster assembly ATPase SufC
MTVIFYWNSYGGSTLQVMGDNNGGATGEWSIIGGTGKLWMARGTIKYTVVQINNVENYRKLDFYGTYIPPVVSPCLQ